MTGKQWIKTFLECLYERRDIANSPNYNKKPSKWTEFMVEKVIKEGVGEKIACEVRCRETLNKKNSGEYLNIDATFFKKADYNKSVYIRSKKEYDPRVLPIAIIEHENPEGSSDDKIAHCLWKLLCIRSELRVLICYHNNINVIRKSLEDTVIDGRLGEELRGELFVIIGNRLKDKNLWYTLDDIKNYFSIFQWSNNKLEKLS